jgi:hypothetical protein
MAGITGIQIFRNGQEKEEEEEEEKEMYRS